MWRFLRVVLTAVTILAFLGVGLLLFAAGGRGNDALTLDGAIERVSAAPEAPTWRAGERLRVGTYNIAYGRGAGTDVGGPWTRTHIERNLAGIAERLREWDLDIVALQEVDFDASRSHYIDQGRWLAENARYPYYACVVTWQNNYVPFPYWPPERHYGRMKTGQCVLSRYPLESNTRHRLPQPDENPFWYNWFYLHRAVQHVVVRLAPELHLDVYNAHLEAYGTTNRNIHATTLVELVGRNPSRAVLILGDFNALPPNASKQHGFSDEPEMDFRGDATMDTVYATGWTEALTGAVEEAAAFTFPASAPARRLDYVFGRGVRLDGARVARDAGTLSDHLPVLAEAELLTGG